MSVISRLPLPATRTFPGVAGALAAGRTAIGDLHLGIPAGERVPLVETLEVVDQWKDFLGRRVNGHLARDAKVVRQSRRIDENNGDRDDGDDSDHSEQFLTWLPPQFERTTFL